MADDLFSVEGKRILLTGGGAGIGRMLTEGLAERGARIFTASRKQDVLDEMVGELAGKRGLDVHAQAADLTDMAQVESLAQAAADHFGGAFDALINNSGATWGGQLGEYPLDGWDRVFDLNVKALFHLTQCSLPYLKQGGTSEDPARIVNIGSVSGIGLSPPNAWAYWPAKAAVHQLTRALAKDLAADCITVNAIAPGIFPSRMTKFMFGPEGETYGMASEVPLGRIGQPEDMVGTMVYLLSRAGAFVTGTVAVLDGGALLV